MNANHTLHIVRIVLCCICLIVSSNLKLSAADDVTIEILFNGKDLHTLNGIAGENKITLPTDILELGPNLMTVRVKDAKGNQSTSYTRAIYVVEGGSISAAEYFVDTDPGEGKGGQITVTGNSAMDFSVPTSALSIGMHTLYVRVCSSDGIWGAPLSKTFMVTRNGVTLEWFFDEDPGVGNGNMVEAAVGENIVPINLSGLEPGAHLLSFRCRTSSNKQSVTTSRLIYVMPENSDLAAEYFVDNDPGEGMAKSLSIGQDGVMSIAIGTDNLSVGNHTLTVRVKVAEDTWMPIYSNGFAVTEKTGILSVEMDKGISIVRDNNAVTLVSHNVENGSSVKILTLDGIVRYSAVWEDVCQPLVGNLSSTLKNLIIVVDSQNGKRLINQIR